MPIKTQAGVDTKTTSKLMIFSLRLVIGQWPITNVNL